MSTNLSDQRARSLSVVGAHHICEWKRRYEREKQRRTLLKHENAALLERVRALTRSRRDVSTDEDSGEEDSKLPTALWNEHDGITRCDECAWEVVHGVCYGPGCNKMFAYDSDEDSDDGKDEGIFTEELLNQSDRCLQPRGTTPLLDVDTSGRLPPDWRGTREMYKALMERGATRLMITTFQMQFFDDRGIIAWADEDIYKHFSGPGMKDGDKWMIMLGRRFKLDEDDVDGSTFIEDLLEDVITGSWPAAARTWETVRLVEDSNIWVTRPVLDHLGQGQLGQEAEEETIYVHSTSSEDDSRENEGGEDGDEDEDAGDTEEGEEYPVLHFDEYEASDVDPNDIANEPEPVFVDANITDDSDDAYESPNEDNEDDEEADQIQADAPQVIKGVNVEVGEDIVPEVVAQEEEVLAMEVDGGSEPGSGWDSDEELSGDEDVIRGRI